MRRFRPFVVFVLALILADSAAAAPGDPGCRFDFDEDGSITEQDVAACFSWLQIVPPVYNSTCDGNGEGVLSISDLAAISTFIGLDCTASVSFGSAPGRSLLVMVLLLAGAFALRIESTARSEG